MFWRRKETEREKALRKGRKAIAGVRKYSAWLRERPFSDKHDGDEGRTAAGGSGSI